MPTSELICQQCGEPFMGRSNRKFCSDAHKNLYHYENRDVPSPEPIRIQSVAKQVKSIPDVIPVYLAPQRVQMQDRPQNTETHDSRTRWLIQQEQEEAAEEAEMKSELHKQYSAIIVKCIKASGSEFDGDELQTWIDELDAMSEKYRSHPDLQVSDDLVHARLDDLYWLRDRFKDLLEEFQDQEPSWGDEEEPMCFQLSAKRRDLFRAHLLG